MPEAWAWGSPEPGCVRVSSFAGSVTATIAVWSALQSGALVGGWRPLGCLQAHQPAYQNNSVLVSVPELSAPVSALGGEGGRGVAKCWCVSAEGKRSEQLFVRGIF